MQISSNKKERTKFGWRLDKAKNRDKIEKRGKIHRTRCLCGGWMEIEGMVAICVNPKHKFVDGAPFFKYLG